MRGTMNKFKKFLERTFQFFAIAGLLSFSFITPAFATTLQSGKITLDDSRVSTISDETVVIQLSGSNDFIATDTILYDWPADFTFPTDATWVTGDFTFNDGSSRTIIDVGATPTCTGGTDNVAVTTDQTNKTLSVEACATYSASSTGATITLTVDGGNVTNPASTGSKIVAITETDDDLKNVLVIITDGVLLTASVAETLSFSSAARTAAQCNTLITGGSENNDSTSTTLPFGALTADTFFNECQRLSVGTNASAGYSTTIQTTTLPTSGGDTILQGDCDGACSLVLSAPWNTESNNYGYAFCVQDSTGDAAITADATEWTVAQQCVGGSQAFMLIANAGAAETAKAMMSSAIATTTNDITDIGVRINIGAGQQAGSYSTTVVYITTPTF